MTLKPLQDRVVIKKVEEEQKSAGGIIIPDTAKERPTKGDVVAVGPGKLDKQGQRMEMSVQPGDRVMYGKFAGTEVSIEGEDHLVMREEDIIAKVES
ncbi:co-chaperone GroES [Desulfovermiculus halophilus]|jgi:chaperonin GroES|uniref:co-chaperone GroES n=1 Tax=Desulfovermiculus halophilus TaxID=339722 RepID=UPI0004872CF8|nr:co-chaperone GroES [Desulfovermiculus halophilus]